MNPKVDTYPQNYLNFLFRQSGAGSSATRLRNARLVPSNARKKDLICAPVGSSTPFVLRSTGKRDNIGIMQYRLVGRCYVHGFMDGEAMSEIRTKLNSAARDKVSDEENRNLVLAQLKSFILV
jgi:hypothetical protein